MADTPPSRPVPRLSPALAPYFAAAREHRLVVQKCGSCGALRFPAREVCSSCWSREAAWVPVSGRGQVFSFYVMHQVYHPAFAGRVPYTVAVVQLDEGPHVTSAIEGCAPAEVRIGMPVQVAFEELSGEVTLPVFRPA